MLVLDCDCATSMTTLWVTVLDPTTTAEHEEGVKIFPNPANDQINISAVGLKQVEVTDVTGKEILGVQADHDNLQLDLSHLKSGIYMIRTVSEQGVSTHKILKQ